MPSPHEKDLIVFLGNYPEPADADAAAASNPVAARLLDNWRTHMPVHERNGTGDVEDFWEMAARLTAGLEAGTERVWLHLYRHDATLTVNGHPTEEQMSDEVAARAITDGTLSYYGPLDQGSRFWHAIDNRADAYHATDAFTDHAGRVVVTCGFMPEPSPATTGAAHVEQVLAQFADNGHDEVIVKAVRAKHGLWRVPTSPDQHVNGDALMKMLGWAMIGIEGSPNTLCVQQVIDMRFEYRVFVVDGEPVTGAGCVEEHTPLHSSAAPFSILVREHRSVYTTDEDALAMMDTEDPIDREGPSESLHGPVVARPDLVDQYRMLARQVAQQAMTAGSMPRGYVIDCAMSDGKPVVIEMNGLTNAGLYASQPWLVTQALMS